MNPRAPLLLSVTLAGAALSGCGAASPAATSTGSGAVAIKNFAFGPTPVSVTKGTAVTWTNRDSSVHTATAVDKSFDTGNIEPGKSAGHTFDAPGTFAYRCSIHQYMTGSIVVTG
ncbi:MAG: putative Cupredoxin [Chloroflexi bacterium]|jgi:plastocyanin|nr:putative Cupredoxin [Chloroflexota bacterium]